MNQKIKNIKGYKYNYIFCGFENDYNQIPFADIIHMDNVHFYKHPLEGTSNILIILYRIYTLLLKRNIILPCGKFFNRYCFQKEKIDNKIPICFVYTPASLYMINHDYIVYIKKRYTSSKHILFCQDIHRFRKLDIERLKWIFDGITIFDKQEAIRAGVDYYPMVYSKIDIRGTSNEVYDICFIGQAKTRLNDIIDIFEILNKHDIRCAFYISGNVPMKERRFTDKIHYISSMPYQENLQIINASNCMLELKLEDTDSLSQRINEAIVYGKKILTNNPKILHEPYYNSEYIQVYTDPSNIDINFIKQKDDSIDYHYSEIISPLALLDYLEKYFEQKDSR